MIKTDKKHFMTKADILLVAGVMIAALSMLLFLKLYHTEESYALVSYDGEAVFQISLLEPERKYYLFMEDAPVRGLSEEDWEDAAFQEALEEGSAAYNVVMCQDGKVSVVAADCPDGICVHHAAISRTGENIICLPHKFVIEIVGREGRNLDGVVY